MSDLHHGGCQCGAVRYRTSGQPHKTAVCHCRYCQTRTGSAFGVSAYFDTEKLEIERGDLKQYSFTTESGRGFTTQFCTNCGTTLFWTVEGSNGATGVAAGTFDAPAFWFDVSREIFTRSRASFVQIDVEHHFETTASYAPVGQDEARLRGG